jgi:hypothetical protein
MTDCGIAGGTLYCWGDNGSGEDGQGDATEYTTPGFAWAPPAVNPDRF